MRWNLSYISSETPSIHHSLLPSFQTPRTESTYLRLIKNRRPTRIQSHRKQSRKSLSPPVPQLRRFLRNRQSMQIHNREKQFRPWLRFILKLDPLPECAQVIAQVWYPGWLNAGEDDGHLGWWCVSACAVGSVPWPDGNAWANVVAHTSQGCAALFEYCGAHCRWIYVCVVE